MTTSHSDDQEQIAKLRDENKCLGLRHRELNKLLEKLGECHRCPICCEIVKIPVTAKTVWRRPAGQSCGHVFCLKCLRAWWKTKREANEQLNCPTCRAVVFRENSYVNGFAHYMRVLTQQFAQYDALLLHKYPDGFDCQNNCGQTFKGCDDYWHHLKEKCLNSIVYCRGPTSSTSCDYNWTGKRGDTIVHRCIRCAQKSVVYELLNDQTQKEEGLEAIRKLELQIQEYKNNVEKATARMATHTVEYNVITARMRSIGLGIGVPLPTLDGIETNIV